MVDGVIVLYEQNETNFTSNGLGYLSDVIECTVSEELNGEYELEMEYPVDGIRYSEIQHRRILYVKPNPYEDPQPFRIYNINRPIDGRVEINARHISYDLSGYTVSESEDKHIPFSTSPKIFCEKIPSAMTELNSGMPQFTFWTNSVEEYDSETYAEEGDELKEKHWIYIDTPSSVRSLIGQFTEKYKGEFKFDKYAVKFYGPISGQSEDDKHYRGIDSGVVLRYGKNLTDLMQEEDSDKGMYTHLYPYWSGTVNTTKTETDSESDESSSSTTTTYSSNSEEKVVTMTNKLYPIFDHDVGYKRVLIYEVNSDWSDKHPNNTDDATPWPSEEEFEELCKEYIKNNELGAPKITLTASFVQLSRSAEYEDLKPLEKVLLGDTVSVLWEDLGVNSTLKCTKTEYDALTDSYKSITLGNDANASISSTVAATSSGLSGVTSSMNDKVSKEEFYNQTYDTALSTTSTNAVQNKVVTSKFNEMKRCCNEVKGEIEYLKEFVSSAGGTLSYGTDIPTGGEDGDGYVQIAQGGGSNPVTLTVGRNTGNFVIEDFVFNHKKYAFNVTGTGNSSADQANINATGLIADNEYRVNFTAKMSSNATYYRHNDYSFGVNVNPYDDLTFIYQQSEPRGNYIPSEKYQSFYEDNATHNYSFTFRTGSNEDKVSLTFSFHDVQDNNPVTLTVTNFEVSSTSGGDNEIVDLWFKIDGEWLKYQVDNEPVFTYGTANPNSNTEGDIYAKIHGGSLSPYTKTLDLSKAICSSSYPSYGIAKFENGEIILKITSAGNFYENSAAAWKQDLTDVSSIEATCYHTILGSYGVCLGVGTRSKLHDNETGPVETRGYIHDEIVGYHSETISIPINQEFSITTDVSSLTGEHYICISTDINEELHITDVKMHLINPEPELVIDDIFYKINGEWKTEDNSGGSTVSVTPIQTTGTHIADIEVDGVIAELYAPTGGGGGSGTTQELLYSGNSLSNSIQLSKPWTDFDALYILGGANESGSVFEFASTLFKDDLATDYRIGITTDIGYIWYSITNNTTLSLMGAYTGYYIKAIRGIKFSSGGGGSGGGYTKTLLYDSGSDTVGAPYNTDIPLLDSLNNYDFVMADYGVASDRANPSFTSLMTCRTFAPVDELLNGYDLTMEGYGTRYCHAKFTNTTFNLWWYSDYVVFKLYGIKLSGGSGGGSGDIPDGGTTGQVLGKLSDADQDFGWINQSGGGSYTETVLYDTWDTFDDGSTITLSDRADNYDAVIIFTSYHELAEGNFYTHFGSATVYKEQITQSIAETQLSGNGRGLISFMSSPSTPSYHMHWVMNMTAPNVMCSRAKNIAGWPSGQCGIYKVVGIKFSGGSGGTLIDLYDATGDLPTPTAGTNNVDREYLLNDNINNYDAIMVSAAMYVYGTEIEQCSSVRIEKDLYYLPSSSSDIHFSHMLNGTTNNSFRRLCFGFNSSGTKILTRAFRTDSGLEPMLLKVYGYKYGGSGGGQRTETPILASPITTTGTYQVTDYSDADELVFEIGVYSGGVTQVFTTVVLASTLRKGWDVFVGQEYFNGGDWAANASIRYVDDTHIKVNHIGGAQWSETKTIFSITKVCY